MRALIATLALPLALPALATPALAAEKREWEVGVTAFGLVNGSFLTEIDDNKKTASYDDREYLVLYPGFGGVGGGGGISVVGMWRGIVGLELQLFGSVDKGDGSLQFNNIELDFTVGQTALHLPILLRAAVPVAPVRPFVFGGPEIVFPGEAEVTDKKYNFPNVALFKPQPGAHADTYVAWAFGLGFEFMLPIDGVDLRIPLTLRGVLNPGAGDTGDDRLKVVCDGGSSQCPPVFDELSFKTEWEWQADVTLGLAYYFL